jgi:hypothetical protein
MSSIILWLIAHARRQVVLIVPVLVLLPQHLQDVLQPLPQPGGSGGGEDQVIADDEGLLNRLLDRVEVGGDGEGRRAVRPDDHAIGTQHADQDRHSTSLNTLLARISGNSW